LSGSYLVTEGFYDEDRSLLTKGMIGTPPLFSRESYYSEHFHYLPYHKVNIEAIRIQEDLEPGDTAELKIRGAGQFGAFLKAVSEQEDWTLRIYTDNDRET
jgi:hypothetical protein